MKSRLSLGYIPSTTVLDKSIILPKEEFKTQSSEYCEDFAPHIINKINRTWPTFFEDVTRDLDESLPEKYDVILRFFNTLIGWDVKGHQTWTGNSLVPKW